MGAFLENLNRAVWAGPVFLMILTVGAGLSLGGGFPQLRFFRPALGKFAGQLRGKQEKDASYRALCTALAATVGTGNIAGVAGAIALGGPGAVFWMWVCAVLGMGLKFSEAVLAVRFRVRGKDGALLAGPMYMISRGMGKKWTWMGKLYALFGVTAAFGVGGAAQVQTVMTGIRRVLSDLGRPPDSRENLLMGVLLGALAAGLLLSGPNGIGKTVEKLVPAAACGYLLLGAGALILRGPEIPGALGRILRGAFCPRAVTGGVIGSAASALRIGLSRGMFTNEAGMGTAAIAHGTGNPGHPVEQGFLGIVEVFVDTVLICTVTALVILTSGAEIPYGTDPGAELTARAFSRVLGCWASGALTLALGCFAFATVLGWGFYGLRCGEYLLGSGCLGWFALAEGLVIAASGVMQTGTVWVLSELVNGLMAVPNLAALWALRGELFRLIRDYPQNARREKYRRAYSSRS